MAIAQSILVGSELETSGDLTSYTQHYPLSTPHSQIDLVTAPIQAK
jgi:hypothetical protein